jgi:hypothetical protein
MRERLEVSVSFDPTRGYFTTGTELRIPVVALSLGGLRRRIKEPLIGEDLDVKLVLHRAAGPPSRRGRPTLCRWMWSNSTPNWVRGFQSSFLPSQARAHHFALHLVIELDPSFFHLWSKCSAKLLFQAPNQRVAKRSEMQWLRPELCVLATRMANDRLEYFALVERTNNGSDHVHQFEVLPFHVAPEQALRIRGEFKKPAVKLVSELSTDWPDRVERLSDKLSLFRRHDWQPEESEVSSSCSHK